MPIFDNYTLYYVSIHATIYVYPFIEVGLHVNTTAGRPKCHKIVGGGGGGGKIFFFASYMLQKKICILHVTCRPHKTFFKVWGGGGQVDRSELSVGVGSTGCGGGVRGGSGVLKRVECRRGVHGLWGGGVRGGSGRSKRVECRRGVHGLGGTGGGGDR